MRNRETTRVREDVFPNYTRSEVIADACVHAIGVTAGAIAAITLVTVALLQLPTDVATAVVIYALGMLAMFCFSAAYNLSRGPRRWLLRRCDHAAIFIKIAATYTPFAAAKMGGTTGIALLAAVWGIALAGAAAKLFFPRSLARGSFVLYLAQGWACVFTLQPLVAALSPIAMTLLLAGGVLYTVGVMFHLRERLPYHNAIWHGFVLVASGCHFAAVLDAVVLG
jgi:hemolysin III